MFPQNYPNSTKKIRPIVIASLGGIAAILLIVALIVWQGRSGHQSDTNNDGTAKTQENSSEEGQKTADKPKADSPKAKEQSGTDSKKSTQPSSQPGASGGSSSEPSGSGNSDGGGSSGGGGSGTSCSSGTHAAGASDGAGDCWPGASNTGVPSGTVLSAYTGPSTITTPNTTITSKIVNTDLFIQASGVVIKNSRINGHIDVDGGGYSLTVEDSEIHASSTSAPALGYNDLTVRRTEITGGQHSILCSGNCSVSDSWLHDQYNPPGGSTHNNAFLSNGGSNMTLDHNTLDCTPDDNGTGGGCTADASFFGDFAVIANITVNNNLFVATPSGGYCGSFGHNPGKTFGSNPTNVIVTNNIFQRGSSGKCGVFGAVTSFLAANGNSWSNNKYDNGAAVNP